MSAIIHTARTSDGRISNDVAAVAASVPFVATTSTGRRLHQAELASATAVTRATPRKRELLDAASRPFFDVDGDGKFSAADYVMLGQLSVLWTNEYADDASPWLQAFEGLNNGSAISDWQLQSTDPDFMCVRIILRCTSDLYGVVLRTD